MPPYTHYFSTNPRSLIDKINRHFANHPGAVVIGINYHRLGLFLWEYTCLIQNPQPPVVIPPKLIIPIGKPIPKDQRKLIIPIGKPIKKNNWKLIIPVGTPVKQTLRLTIPVSKPMNHCK